MARKLSRGNLLLCVWVSAVVMVVNPVMCRKVLDVSGEQTNGHLKAHKRASVARANQDSSSLCRSSCSTPSTPSHGGSYGTPTPSYHGGGTYGTPTPSHGGGGSYGTPTTPSHHSGGGGGYYAPPSGGASTPPPVTEPSTPIPITPTPSTPSYTPTPTTPTYTPTPTSPYTPYTPTPSSPLTPYTPTPTFPLFPPPTPSSPLTPYTPTPTFPLFPPPTPSSPLTPYTPTPTFPLFPPTTPSSPLTPYTPTPTHPLFPPAPYTPSPSHPGYGLPPVFTGTCDYWKKHPQMIWGILGYWGTLGGLLGNTGTPLASFGVLDALRNTRTDGVGALYREGTAAFLNSMVNRQFPFSTPQVRDAFMAALASDQAAAYQARVFRSANEGRLRH